MSSMAPWESANVRGDAVDRPTMVMNRILCPIDLSERSIELLQYAAMIQHWYGGDLTLLHVVPTFDAVEAHAGDWFDPVTVAYPMLREDVIERIRDAVAAAGISEARLHYEAAAGHPAAAILDTALALSADLIVVGTQARSGLDGVLLGSVADTILRRAPCDVVTVPADVRRATRRAVSSIACGVDSSPEALHVARAAFEIAGRTSASLLLVHAIEWIADEQPTDYVDFNVAEYRARLVYNAQHSLDALVDRASAGQARSVRTRVVVGRAYREVLAVARSEDADLIVIGQHGGPARPLPLIGGTADQIVRGASCPVLTVRGAHTSDVA
jgi:nucleotide-binding universal stress UspA family protein